MYRNISDKETSRECLCWCENKFSNKETLSAATDNGWTNKNQLSGHKGNSAW